MLSVLFLQWLHSAVFYAALVLMLFVGAVVMFVIYLVVPTRNRAKKEAEEIAQSTWYLSDIGVYDELVVLALRESSSERTVCLGFLPKHPDFSLMKDLQCMDVIQFRFQLESLEAIKPTSPDAYLRLESSGRVW